MRYLTTLIALCLSVVSFASETPCLDPLACNFMEEGECFFTDENGDPCVIEGCTIEGACNYDPAADIYDGSCEFESCLGCTDSEACNYDETALYDDATCIYYVDCNGTCGGNWIEDACGNCYQITNNGNGVSLEFLFTGTEQTFIVPEGVNSLQIECWGASGGEGHHYSPLQPGGKGGYAAGSLTVSSGQVLSLFVGGEGARSNNSPIAGGYNGGGDGDNYGNVGWYCAGGGGATDVRSGGTMLENRIIVAGGGGGGGGSGSHPNGGGGDGGGPTGADGFDTEYDDPHPYGDRHGKGGSQFAGGSGGTSQSPFGSAGVLGIGGNASAGSNALASGGGGGYFGGGGGSYHGGAGGGGSSYVGGVIDGLTTAGVNTGNGRIVLSWFEIPNCIPGCTYPQACNYNPESNFDDGSCDYCFCLDGTQWSDSLQGCVSTAPPLMDACGAGTYWDEESQACLTTVTCAEDLNTDGIVGISDLLQLLSMFGTPCDEVETNVFTCGDPLIYQGHAYSTVLFDTLCFAEQCWFAENLRVEFYLNGDSIPGDLSNSEWANTTAGAQAVFENNPQSLSDFGRLYNSNAVSDIRGICPTGWHVPTMNEVSLMLDFHGGTEIAGEKLKASPTDTHPWDGTNESGFTGLPGGERGIYGQYSSGEGSAFSRGRFYTSTTNAAGRHALGVNAGTTGGNVSNTYDVRVGFSIRCLKDSE